MFQKTESVEIKNKKKVASKDHYATARKFGYSFKL